MTDRKPGPVVAEAETSHVQRYPIASSRNASTSSVALGYTIPKPKKSLFHKGRSMLKKVGVSKLKGSKGSSISSTDLTTFGSSTSLGEELQKDGDDAETAHGQTPKDKSLRSSQVNLRSETSYMTFSTSTLHIATGEADKDSFSLSLPPSPLMATELKFPMPPLEPPSPTSIKTKRTTAAPSRSLTVTVEADDTIRG